MLNKNDVLALRDFALSQLPRVQRQADIAYDGGGRRAEMQAIAFAPVGVPYSRQPTVIELQAARLLHLVGMHPDTHAENLNDDVAGDDFPGELTSLLEADAERDRNIVDQLLVDAAKELSRLSAVPLPPALSRNLDLPNTGKTPDALPLAKMPISIKHKLRTNTLDAVIEKAIQKAGSSSPAAVYVQLRELALQGDLPFTGAIEGSSLCYTNDDNQSDKLTKNALGKRLERRK